MTASLSLLKQIELFRAANRRGGAELPDGDEASEQYLAEVLNPPTFALLKWLGPAANHQEALEALRLADETARDNDYTHSFAAPLVEAAIGYLQLTSDLLSVELSPEISLAASAIAVFRNRLEDVCEERNCLDEKLSGLPVARWPEKPEGRLREYLCEQEEALATVNFALESFVRARTCGTLGDLLHKLAQDEVRLRRDRGDEDDSRENVALLKSLLPWMRKVGALDLVEKRASE
ncbi:hypothetical protein [Neorhizobium galegae]|uniref:Uncharacterized protein n=1 Tax=Neorhizobium galegae bv. officinalis TaxID=323656 RepID=A0A0T7H0K8_NEOGA|nr:hypothetical protein [Neorhizobium galegae]CDZ53055.1 Hypothetical protein NGAL_HAMBI1189_47960 [Neorhizobium galegae bv. officinalis]